MTAEPSALEQLSLELINRARSDPLGELDRLIPSRNPLQAAEPEITSALNFFNVDIDLLYSQLAGVQPVAPVAWNESLGVSSATHSQLMIDFDEQSHNLPGEPGLRQRFTDAGYASNSWIAENAFAFSQTPLYGHAGFYIDWGFGPGGIQDPAGHRDTILSPLYDEVGIGIIEETDPNTAVGRYVTTHHFGKVSGSGPKLTGVAINDTDNDDFYDIGEGLGAITVTARGVAGTFSTVTYASGGYTLAVPSGTYTVTFSGAGLGGSVSKFVIVGVQNVKVDAEAAEAPLGADLVGSAGDDVLFGTPVGDTLSGEGGNDVLDAGAGANTLLGGSGDDTLTGGDNQDTLNGGSGSDTFVGGGGADVIIVDASGDVVSDGGAGFDKVQVNTAAGVSLSVGSWVSVERIIGFTGSDVIDTTGMSTAMVVEGRESDDTLIGGTANDILIGGAGDDSLAGGAGNDLLLGGAGNDTFSGGAGNDSFFIDASGDVVVDGGAGFDKAVIDSAAGVSLTVGGWTGVERVNGFTGADTIDAGTNTTGIVLSGGGGGDTLSGGTGNDILLGGAGDDSLIGGAGDDTLLGGTGNDSFDGGAGNDILFIGEAGDVVFDGGAGTDKAVINTAAGISIDVGGWTGVEQVNGFTGADTIDAGTNTAGITLQGGGGADTLTGGSGDDTFFAGTGDDTVSGGAGADALIGSAGADVLAGGAGDDFLLGGVGSDSFVFADGFGADLIQDFDALDDAEKIDLAGVTNITDFTDLSTNHMAQTGLDVTITDGADTITLANTTLANLDQNDFTFV